MEYWFENELTENVENVLKIRGIEADVKFKDVQKNNVTKRGICIIEKGSNIHPVIYIDMYKEYDDMNFEDEAKHIVNSYMKGKSDMENLKNVNEMLQDAEYLKRNARLRIVNREANEKIVENAVHECFMDLAAIVYIEIEEDDSSVKTCIVPRTAIDMLEIDEKELFEVAKNNSLEKVSVMPLALVMARMAGYDEDAAKEMHKENPMYVCTNDSGLNGAVGIIEPDVFKKVADENDDDLYILPSSIHEILVVPASLANVCELRNMVKEVNKTEVSPEDILGYNVYKFDRKTGEIRIA